MTQASLTERRILETVEQRWTQLGYTVIREPRRDQLPAFLQGMRPDAIAVGQQPSIVIEILDKRSRASDTKLRQFHTLFQGRDDWRLEVVYASSEGAPVQSINLADIKAAITAAEDLKISEPRAGLLLAWSALEAVTRILEPDLASNGLSTSSVVDLLVSMGHLPQPDAGRLRGIGEIRNLLAHGQLNQNPAVDDLQALISLVRKLTAEAND